MSLLPTEASPLTTGLCQRYQIDRDNDMAVSPSIDNFSEDSCPYPNLSEISEDDIHFCTRILSRQILEDFESDEDEPINEVK